MPKHSRPTLFLLSCLTIWTHCCGIIFCSGQTPAALQTLAILDGPIPSLLRLWTNVRTALERWAVTCDRCILDLDGVVESGCLCSAMNLMSTHYDISFNTTSILARQSHRVSLGNWMSCPYDLLSTCLRPSLLQRYCLQMIVWSVLDLEFFPFRVPNPFASAYVL